MILAPTHLLGSRHPERSEGSLYSARTLTLLMLTTTAILVGGLAGCKPTPPPTTTPTPSTTSTQQYPARPTTPPPPFKLFHQTDNTITLVTTPTATDAQITAILWQLRDAAATHTFDKLHIPQKVVDGRDPIIWFHVYRGPKCASEKYTTGKLPCGPSYHAAGEFTYGGFSAPNRTAGTLMRDENHETILWDPDKPYTPPAK